MLTRFSRVPQLRSIYFAIALVTAMAAPSGFAVSLSATEPLRQAHAHNDYEHSRPLLDALDNGFTSVEADVFAHEGELKVAHYYLGIRQGRTLKSLYLEPLKQIAAKNKGFIYPDESTFTLLVDFKSDDKATYELLAKTLAEYRELVVAPAGKENAPVQVIISGNRPFSLVQNDESRLCGLDGRVSDLNSTIPASILPLISDNWGKHFKWDGNGPMPAAERDKLVNIVERSHAAGRRVRFWATPEREAVWSELLSAGVDHINTDKLARLATFLTSAKATKKQAQEKTKTLIVHADDAGMSHSVNRGTIEALEKGIVSSASIMVPCAWFSEFAEYCRKHPDGDYGIHLTLNSEWDYYRWGPVAEPAKVPSLVDPQGYLWDNVAQVAQHADAEEAKVELKAQIDRALKFGVPLSHLDTHMGALLSRPDLLAVYVDLAVEYDLPILFVDASDPQIASAYPALAKAGAAQQERLEKARLPILSGVGQFYGGDTHEGRREAYLNYLRNLTPGTHELIIHCGYDDEELKGITSSSSRRNGDRIIFTDSAIQQLIEELGIELTTWKAFRAKVR